MNQGIVCGEHRRVVCFYMPHSLEVCAMHNTVSKQTVRCRLMGTEYGADRFGGNAEMHQRIFKPSHIERYA